MPLTLPKPSDLRAALPQLPTRNRPAAPDMPPGYAAGARRRRGPLGRWLVRGCYALVILSGVLTIGGNLVNSLSGPPAAPPAAPAGIDPAVARQLATTFTTDYFTYDSVAPELSDAALARWTGQDSFDAWNGPGVLTTDVVVPGAVIDVDTNRLIVQTTARVTATTRGDAGVLIPDAPRWLTLDVAIARADGQLTVTGATFTGDLPQVVLPSGREADSDLGRATVQLAGDTFAALATGDLAYITAPDARLTGLADEVTVADVSNWRVDRDPTNSPTRTAAAAVTWRLVDTELTTTQTYALRLVNDDGRWLVAATGTNLED